MKKSPPKKKESGKHRFCIRKYVMAKTAAEAMKLDKKAPVHEVFIDDKQPMISTTEAVGFEFNDES